MKKYQVCIFVSMLLAVFQPAYSAGKEPQRKIVPPKECRTTRYSCVLKKADGVPFFCVRTTKQRYQNARKSIRVVSRRNCLRRYPVEYEPVKTKPENTE